LQERLSLKRDLSNTARTSAFEELGGLSGYDEGGFRIQLEVWINGSPSLHVRIISMDGNGILAAMSGLG